MRYAIKGVQLALPRVLVCFLITAILVMPARGWQTNATRPAGTAGESDKRPVVIPLAHGGDRLFVRVRVKGQDVGWWLLHTGDPGIIIDVATARRLDLPVVEKIWGAGRNDPDASLLLLDKLQVGSAPVRPHLVVAMDLSDWRRAVGVDISGIVGWAFLRDRPSEIDFRAGTLTLFSPGDVTVPAKPTFAGTMNVATGVPSVQGDLDGKYSGWFKIDSSESSPLLLSAIFSALHTEAWTGKPLLAASRFGAVNVLGTSKPVMARWQSKGTLPQYPKLLTCGSVGGPFLRSMRITFDPSTNRLWAEQLATESLHALLVRLGDPKGRDLIGVTPLMRAAAEGRPDGASALLNRGADANALDVWGRAPLVWACEAGSASIVRLLLAHGAQPDLADKSDGSTALIKAVIAGDVSAVKALLDAGARPDKPDLAGATPLRWAVAGDLDEIAAVLLAHGASPNLAGRDGLSPFLAAAEWNATHALRVLLKREIPRADSKTGRTLLMEASQHNAAGAIGELIRAGADVNARSVAGKTALMEAAGSGATDATRMLLAAGADPSIRSAEGNDGYTYAFEGGKQCDSMLLYPLSHRAVPVASHPSSRPAKMLIRAQRGGPYLFLPASINGRQPIPMLLDTGAIGMVIDKSLADQLHLKTISSVDDPVKDTLVVEVPRLQIGGVSVGPVFAFVIDLSGMRKAFGIQGPFAIGMPFLDMPIKIDFPAAEVEVYEHSAFQPPPDAPAAPLRTMASSYLCLPAVLFGTDHVSLALDTGDTSQFVLSGPYGLMHPDGMGQRLDFASHQGLFGRKDSLQYRMRAIDLFEVQRSNITADVELSSTGELGLRPPGVIGAGILQRCTLWLDPSNNRAWAKWLPDDEPLYRLLRRIGTDPGDDLFHTTPLIRAVDEGRRDAVAALLQKGAKSDDADTSGFTPLRLACGRGDQQIANLLLDYKATPDAEDLRAAASRGLVQVVDRLLKKGISPRKNPIDRLVPLHWAALSNDPRIVDSLVAAGADPDERDTQGRTALMACAAADCPAAAAALLKHDADVEAAIEDGRRPLMVAAQENSPKVVALLLAHGAQVDAADQSGKTAIMYAAGNPDVGTVRMLLEAGAKPGLANKNDATALQYAAEARIFSNAEAIYRAMNPSP